LRNARRVIPRKISGISPSLKPLPSGLPLHKTCA
jgi:hypothetical protein